MARTGGLVAGAGLAGWGIGRWLSNRKTDEGVTFQHGVEDFFAKIFLNGKGREDYDYQNNIELKVMIEKDGRVRTESNDMKTNVNARANTGAFFGGQ